MLLGRLQSLCTWKLAHQLLQMRLRVTELTEDLLGAVGGLDERLVVREGQLLCLGLNAKHIDNSFTV
jgi:hypothetical protein